jgi:hypothetical protein
MNGKWVCGLIAVFCFELAGGVCPVQGADPAHFQAMGLVRFATDIDLPDINLPDVQGKDVPLRSFRRKVVLLNFWTTW